MYLFYKTFSEFAGEVVSKHNATMMYRVVQVNETAYRVELLSCEGDEAVCREAEEFQEVFIEQWGGVEAVFVIPYGEGKVYRFLETRYHSYFSTVLWASKEVLEDAVRSFQILSNLISEFGCGPGYKSPYESTYEAFKLCERECISLPEYSKEWERCYWYCFRRHVGEVPIMVLTDIVLKTPHSPTQSAPFPECVCVRYEPHAVSFERVVAQRLPSAYVYEVAYTAIEKAEQGEVVSRWSDRIKTVFGTSGWLLEGEVESFE